MDFQRFTFSAYIGTSESSGYNGDFSHLLSTPPAIFYNFNILYLKGNLCIMVQFALFQVQFVNRYRSVAITKWVRIDTIQSKKKQPELFQNRLQKLIKNTKKKGYPSFRHRYFMINMCIIIIAEHGLGKCHSISHHTGYLVYIIFRNDDTFICRRKNILS